MSSDTKQETCALSFALGFAFCLLSLAWGFYLLYLAPRPSLIGTVEATNESAKVYDQYYGIVFALIIAEQLVGWITGFVLVVRPKNKTRALGVGLLVGAASASILSAVWWYVANTFLAGF
jgi:hypothetical protein